MRTLTSSFRGSVLMQLKLRAASPATWVSVILVPAVYCSVTQLMLVAGGASAPSAVPIVGGGLVGLWSMLVFNASYDVVNERWWGTLELLIPTPSPLWQVLAAKVLGTLLLGGGALPLGLVVAVAFGARVPAIASPAALAACAVVLGIAFYSAGLLLASAVALARPAVQYVNAVAAPVTLVTGLLVPLERLPSWVQAIGAAFPQSWAVRALYASIADGSVRPVLLLAAIGLSLTYMLVASLLLRIALHRFRTSGELAFA